MDTQRNGGAVAVGRNVGLVNRLWGRVKAFFQGFVALLLGRGKSIISSDRIGRKKEHEILTTWAFYSFLT